MEKESIKELAIIMGLPFIECLVIIMVLGFIMALAIIMVLVFIKDLAMAQLDFKGMVIIKGNYINKD